MLLLLRRVFAAALLTYAGSGSVVAEAWNLAPEGARFKRVGDRDTFVDIVSRGELKRFGIRLVVQPDGRIGGRAFGRRVSGAWQWRDGYFCRELFWGAREVGANCQAVAVYGDMVRFTSDRGRGDFADLRLR